VKNADELKNIVKDKYGQIAREGGSCCGPNPCCDPLGGTSFAESYEGLDGYFPEADLGLGCGIPTEFAGIEGGQTVIDLGSGAGNDVFVVRALVGAEGRVIGLDMVPDMVARARENAAKLGYQNVEFHLGEIENMPLASGLADVLVSNCVLNLVPDKRRAFAEIHRVLKPGGHFCVSDIVLEGELPAGLAEAAEAYAGCVAGALKKEDYLAAISAAGFTDTAVRSTRQVYLPDTLLEEVLGPGGAAELKDSGFGIYSITVVGYKDPEAP
jgi:ubiquinone/menaquinone biosynthesis C-methylase UbiE